MSEGYTEKVQELGKMLGGKMYKASWGGEFIEPDLESEFAEIACTYNVNISDVEEEVHDVSQAYYKTLMDLVQKQIR